MGRAWVAIPLGVALSLASAPSLAAEQSVVACCAPGTGTNTFTPKTVTIDVGDSVNWRNDAGLHNVKFDDDSFESPAEPSLTPWTATRTFDAPGEFRYYCEQHGNKGGVGMAGTVIVRGGGPSPTPTGDVTPPTISSLRVVPGTFCNKKSDRCPKRGAAIGFKLSEAATVDVTVLRRDTGDVLKTFSFKGKAGTNSFKYSGKDLPLGKYRLELTAVDEAKNRSKPARASFKLAKQR
jgi:plastocyanin